MIESVSEDLQAVIISSLMKDTYLFSKVHKLFDLSFFDDFRYRIIYKTILYHYSKYGNVPSVSALLDEVSMQSTSAVGDISAIRAEIMRLSAQPEESEEYILDKITAFLRTRSIQNTLSKYLPKIKNGDEFSLEMLGRDLSDAVDIDFSRNEALELDDIQNLGEFRRLAVGSNSDPTIIKSSFPEINKALMFGGYKYGDLVAFIAAPGTGKSQTLVNEGVSASYQGFEVLHLFIGDMSVYDGWIRYASNISKVPQNTIVEMGLNDQADLVAKNNLSGVFSRVTMKAYPSESLDTNQLIRDIHSLQSKLSKHFDVIVVDYPDNLIGESDNMYLSGGTIYNKLSGLAQRNRSVVLVASQPKITYYGWEIIPLEGAAESSKKQQNLDLMVTLGKLYRDSTVMTGFIAKNRRGQVGNIFRIRTEFEVASMHQISEIEYAQAVGNHEGGDNK